MHNKNQRRRSPPSSARAPLKSKMAVCRSEADHVAFRVPRDYPHSRFSKAPLAVYPPKGGRPRACVSLPVVSLEKMPCFSQSEGAHVKVTSSSSTLGSSSSSLVSSSSSSLKSTVVPPASHKNQEQLLNGRGPITPHSVTPPVLNDRRPSPSRSPLDKWPAPSPSSQDRRLASSPSASLLDRRPAASASPSLLDRRPAASASPSLLDRRPAASASPSLLDRRPCPPPSSPDRKHPNEAKVSKHRRVSGRIYDPNKHCGVLDPETKRPCTRSLTCKTHSLTHRRAVPGRRKEFDILLAEHKGRAKEKETGQKKEAVNSQSTRSSQSLNTSSSLLSSCQNGKTTPPLKLRLASAHTHRGCGSGGAEVLSSAPTSVPELTPSCSSFGVDARISSDDGESELADEMEKPWCHYSLHHPRPLSWCAFSSRIMGRNHYVFDRRWDRVRIALHCMVEKHVSSQMWRKVPLAVESVVSVSHSLSELSALTPSPGVPAPGHASSLDGVSMVSYSSPFSHNGAGVFCVRDPVHTPKLHQTKPGKPARALGEGVGVKKHKPPPTTEAGTYRKNGNACHPQPGSAHISKGPVTLSGRWKPRAGGQCTHDPERSASVGQPLPQPITADHGGLSSPCAPPCGSTETRKRRTANSTVAGDRPGKVTKTVLDGIFRKSSAGLLSSVADVSHSALP
ncbi:uncharacterized protein atxn7l1 isoform X2 [Brachyhypopomus gauderio]